MTVNVSRRQALAGILATATSVIAIPSGDRFAAVASELWPTPAPLPVGVAEVDPYAIAAPDGWVYQWCRSALMGEPDPANIQMRLDNGWTFVEPEAHPGAPTVNTEAAIGQGGLILMKKPKVLVTEAMRAQREEANKRFGGIDLANAMRATELEEVVETPSGTVRILGLAQLKKDYDFNNPDSDRWTYIGSGSDKPPGDDT
jgi:hypothetical protein